ncbi:P-loop containing nucleoside triphosphate hydrolase protein [Lactarius akahatsu]|uniref:P-loop containing nucleoside triphosphate hydrolase protein n=1 Tax=Lactarius akahatsu TaxID=416441 RepID=A0AAD4QHJ8_9AGAM|nr:P-loop containing nucleoside triphosphate hydrolase protein [Lactarius akahatsu]
MFPDAKCHHNEGWGPVSRLRPFDFTSCFEEGVLFSVPLGSLIVLSLFRVCQLCQLVALRRTQKINVRLLWGKLAILALISLISVANIVVTSIDPRWVTFFPFLVLEAIAFLALLLLTYMSHTRTRRSSTIALLFWLAYFAALLIWSRTTLGVVRSPLPPIFALRWGIGALGLIAFALECLGPEYYSEPDRTPRMNPESPLLTANIFGVWTFGWLTPLIKKGARQFITEDDLPELVPEDEASKLGQSLQRAMKDHKSLWTALFVSYGGPFAFAACLKVLQDCLSFLQPQLLRLFLSFISAYQSARLSDTSGPSPLEGFSIATAMFVAAIIQSILLHQYFQRCYETGMRVRTGLVTAIYQKALVLSNDERGKASGDIVNLMSVDASRLQDLCTYGLMAISAPFQVTLAFVSLYNLLGWSAFVGVAIMIFSVPLNTFIANLMKNLQVQQMKNKDKRSRLMSELLANIRSIKLYAWEHAFLRRILFVRNEQELKMLKKIGIYSAMNTTLWGGIPLLVAFSSFATAAATSSKPLTSDVIFPAISLFMLLQFPLAMAAMLINQVIEGVVSAKRLKTYLSGGELQPDAREVTLNPDLCAGDVVLDIKDGEFTWSKDPSTSPTLEGINLVARKGELVGIVGRVGAGKSSLLSAIIGDMCRNEGKVSLYGTVAYAPQNPWLMGASIRDNILFSHEYDETFYNLVLDACALRLDLELLPNGDLTEVGEKGNLSGGQRARVSLARAVYARADLVLLDDVLAAVDSQVARHVFDQVIGPRGLLATKARIFITHSISFLSRFDQLLYLRRGIIIESGSYAKLAGDKDSHVYKLIHGHGHTSGSTSSGTTTPFWSGEGSTPSGSSVHAEDGTLTEEKIGTLQEKLTHKKSFSRATLAPVTSQTTKASSGGLSEEQSAQGRVKPHVYWRYIGAASKTGFALFVIVMAMQQTVLVLGTFSLKHWSEGNRESGENRSAVKYLWAYGLLSLSSSILNCTASILILVFCSLKSSKHLHDAMLHSVLRAPLTFFELTPSGRILNLFTKDTNVVDQILARVIQFVVRTLCSSIGIVVVIGSSFPPFLIAIIPLGWLYNRFMTYYLATSRELQRLNAVSRSPIISWFSESLSGLSTIRAFGQQAIFAEINERRVDRNQMCYLPSTSVNRWLAVRLEFIGASIIFISSMLAVGTLMTSGVDAGLVGLVISYALNTTSSLNWLVRSASEVEQNIVSVERMLQYIELQPEAPYEVPETQPEGGWPSEGCVEFKNYSLKYRPELDLVLKNISLIMHPGEKIGICGRTGAGKSSLLLALFRILEPAEGTILIDDVDITKIGLYDLRSAMTIVPQSPDLFEGTLRENIDPVGEHQDADIWEALKQATVASQAHLKEYVESLPEGLDAPVKEGGSSLSAGQRQLICFARALLRKTKILVLDEATSAVDLETDKAIQDIIRGPQFKNTTILTIAHRLNTIMDSDRILVLSEGKVAEFDAPSILLTKPDSAFRSLAVEAGLT